MPHERTQDGCRSCQSTVRVEVTDEKELKNDHGHISQHESGIVAGEATTSDADIVEICPDRLDIQKYLSAVGHPSAGAVSSFIGTTRDTFDGKRVIRLEYEAYTDMAIR